MEVEYVCKKCRKISATGSDDVELRGDGTLLLDGEKRTCHSCGNEKFSKMKRA